MPFNDIKNPVDFGDITQFTMIVSCDIKFRFSWELRTFTAKAQRLFRLLFRNEPAVHTDKMTYGLTDEQRDIQADGQTKMN